MHESLVQDKDEQIFAVTENAGSVAMFLMEADATQYTNEDARSLWPSPAYETNLKQLIPAIARDLQNGGIPLSGIKVAR